MVGRGVQELCVAREGQCADGVPAGVDEQFAEALGLDVFVEGRARAADVEE